MLGRIDKKDIEEPTNKGGQRIGHGLLYGRIPTTNKPAPPAVALAEKSRPKMNIPHFNYTKAINQKIPAGKPTPPPPKPVEKAAYKPQFLTWNTDIPEFKEITNDQFQAETDKKYDPMRQRASGTIDSEMQGQKDAIERRFAMLGGGPAGAQEKQNQLVDQDGAGRKFDTVGALNAQQEGENQNLAEAAKGQQFQTMERFGNQAFADAERVDQQNIATMERKASDRANKQMLETATINALREQKHTIHNQRAIAKMENTLAKEGLEWQKTVDEFNMKMAETMGNRKDVFGRMGDNWKPIANMYGGIGGWAATAANK
jgi:hypothetical protein